MPLLLASLLGGLINIAGTLAGQVLIGLGISVLTYTGIDTTLTWVKGEALTSLNGLPVEVIGMLSAMGVGEFINILTSAMTVRLTLDGLTAGTMKSWVKK
jgi:hypothetical protein